MDSTIEYLIIIDNLNFTIYRELLYIILFKYLIVLKVNHFYYFKILRVTYTDVYITYITYYIILNFNFIDKR